MVATPHKLQVILAPHLGEKNILSGKRLNRIWAAIESYLSRSQMVGALQLSGALNAAEWGVA